MAELLRIGADMQHSRMRQSGYTLVEMLVVVAIIGLLSLITVPAFMNFQRANVFRAAMRTFSTDLRNARAVAIQQAFDVKVEIQEGAGAREYQFFSSRDNGTTWTALRLRGNNTPTKVLDAPVWFESTDGLDDFDTSGRNEVIFVPSGQARLETGATIGTITMATDWDNMANNRYYVTITPAGQIKASVAQCGDGLDNDADGQIDAGNDGQCSSRADNNEAA